MKQVSATNYVFCLGLSEWLYETRITFRRFLSLFFVLVLGLQLRTLCKTWQTNYKSFAIKDYLSAKIIVYLIPVEANYDTNPPST